MIFKQETQILKCTFEKEHFSKVKAAFKDRWPVVYIIEDDEKGQAYIGESTNICTRICDHWNNTERRALKNIYIIFNKVFNKSVILDLEAFLIGYIVADGKYRLQNGNGGQHVHNYYLRDEYQREFRHIWQLLQDEGVVRHGITLLENQDLFKYSPYKILNLDQFNVAVQILTDLKYDLGNNNQSRSFIIDGGAGTGKSILGIYLLKLLIDAKSSPAWTAEEEALDENLSYIIGHLSPNLRVGYVVPTQSFRETLKKVFDGIQGLDSKMVLSPEDVANSGEGLYDLLIVDESHRLRRRRALFNYGSYDKANKALELDEEATELDWILKKSRYQLFFYDSRQSVKPSDVEALRFFSLSQQEDTRNYKLTSQMRCKGGNDYIEYINNILECQQEEMLTFGSSYELLLFEDVEDMVSAIKEKNNKMGLCRNMAGYAWPWKTHKMKLSKIQKEGLYDIEIENKYEVNNAHKYIWNTTQRDWINSENSINEIGCIHTTQGYDLNYAGVIIGWEIDYDPINNIITVSKDMYQDAKGKEKVDEKILRNYIKNIYATLLERGMYGTYIYVCNYKRQNKLFHFHKTFCSEFDIINTKQNVHFTKVVSPIFQFCLSLHQFSIGAKVPFINKRD